MKTVSIVVVGAGERGTWAYAPYALAHPHEVRVVAVAEPDSARRARFQQAHGLPDSACFTDYQAFFQHPVPADAVLICTQDQMHLEPALCAMRQGYHVLLEKPMSTREEECRQLVQVARETGRYLMVCHVLRYTPFYSLLKETLEGGAIGRLMTVQHTEGIGHWHFAHSFVRGNWRNAGQSAPMILAKCCHDLDLLHWLVGGHCISVSSQGALGFFCRENAPANAPQRCLDGCPQSGQCPYDAVKMYLGEETSWPVSTISVDQSIEARRNAIQTGPYGRCVYHCDNDVCDHQGVTLGFDHGVTVQFTATAFSAEINRKTLLTGTLGQIEADFDKAWLRIRNFATGRTDEIQIDEKVLRSGHGGGDTRLFQDFVNLIRMGQGGAKTLAEDSLVSHLMAFAAERSRDLLGQLVPLHMS